LDYAARNWPYGCRNNFLCFYLHNWIETSNFAEHRLGWNCGLFSSSDWVVCNNRRRVSDLNLVFLIDFLLDATAFLGFSD
jgi:hypothetical protein